MHRSQLFDLTGKVALVTGGTRGIGLMIARGYVANGVRTYVSARKAEACEAVAAELSASAPAGAACIALPADLSTMAGVERLAAEIGEREPRLHVLVNNAGATWAAPLEAYPESGWDKVMNLNLKSPFFLTTKLLPRLRAAATPEDPARVLMIGSIDGIRAIELDTYPYAASKAALHHLTRVLARQLASDHVNVNAIAPGPFESKMMAETLRNFGDAIRARVPRGRIGEPEDMAGAAIYLASRAGAWITGAVLPVDGGWSTTLG